MAVHSLCESSETVHAQRELWEQEYATLKIIPSSTRTLPSKVLTMFSEIIHFETLSNVLDAGCGNGRNAVYLAHKGSNVYAVDFSNEALFRTRKAAQANNVANRVRLCNCSLRDSLPFKDEYFDLVVDSYVFCHFTDSSMQRRYPEELARVVRPGGFVFSSVFSVKDEYYRSVLKPNGRATRLVVDPGNGIEKRLYTPDIVTRVFERRLNLLYFVDFQFEDVVLGRPYIRDILALVLQK